MKIFKTLIVITGLLCSAQAIACDVYIKVINQSGHEALGVYIGGPWARSSTEYDMKNGDSFTYHATGSAFTCHGKYNLDNLGDQDKCNFDNITVDMEKDGYAYFLILTTSGGGACNIATIKPSKNLYESLDCVGLYSQDNICDYDHWSEIYDQ